MLNMQMVINNSAYKYLIHLRNEDVKESLGKAIHTRKRSNIIFSYDSRQKGKLQLNRPFIRQYVRSNTAGAR